MTLVLIIISVIAMYLLSSRYPVASGVVAVIPIKIIAAMVFSYNEGGSNAMADALRGAIAAQFIFGAVLILLYLCIIR